MHANTEILNNWKDTLHKLLGFEKGDSSLIVADLELLIYKLLAAKDASIMEAIDEAVKTGYECGVIEAVLQIRDNKTLTVVIPDEEIKSISRELKQKYIK
jgi:hypothetical protein